MDLYNDGTVWDIGEPSNNPNMKEMASEFSEGSIYLEKLLLSCWENNIKTFACCAGNKPDDLWAYVGLVYDENSFDYINKIITICDIYSPEVVKCSFWNRKFAINIYDKQIIDDVFKKLEELINAEKIEYSNFFYRGKIFNDYFHKYLKDKIIFDFSTEHLFGIHAPDSILFPCDEYPDLSETIDGLELNIMTEKYYKWDEKSIGDLINIMLAKLLNFSDYMEEFMRLPLNIRKNFIMKYNPSLASYIMKMWDNNVQIDNFSNNQNNYCGFVVNKEMMPFIKRMVNYLDSAPVDLFFDNHHNDHTSMVVRVSDMFKDEIFMEISKLSEQQDNPMYNDFLSTFIEFDFYALLRRVKYRLKKFNNVMMLSLGEGDVYNTGLSLDDILNHFNNTGEIMIGEYSCDLESLSNLASILEDKEVKGYIPFDPALLKNDMLNVVKK